jgi:hypothetical protein
MERQSPKLRATASAPAQLASGCLCSNGAATWAKPLKTQEMYWTRKTLFCRHFANSRKLLKTILLS